MGNKGKLDGRVVVVTGGALGIGRLLQLLLPKRALRWRFAT